MLYIIFITWIITASIASFGVIVALYWKWKEDNDDMFELKYFLTLICLTTICIHIFLPIYIIENKIKIRAEKAYEAIKATLHNKKKHV